MLTHRAPSSFWVLTNWTHTQAVVERTQGAAESEGRAEPGLPWQPVGGAAGEPQTGGALLLGSPQGKMEWGGEKLWPVCWCQVLFLHWLNSQPTELYHLSRQGSLHFFQNGGEVGGWWPGEKNSEASCSVHLGAGGCISGEGGGSYFIHESEFKGRKVPSCWTDN